MLLFFLSQNFKIVLPVFDRKKQSHKPIIVLTVRTAKRNADQRRGIWVWV